MRWGSFLVDSPGTADILRAGSGAQHDSFADVIKTGADRLGWTLDELLDKTIQAMRSCEASINEAMENL